MTDFSGLLVRLARGFEARNLPFMVIGGQAVLVHGEPRLTEDIDVTLSLGPDGLSEVLAACDEIGLRPLPDDPAGFVRSTFVLPTADSTTGIRVDVIFSTTPYEEEAVQRAERVTIGDGSVPVATAEDLIIHKLFAGRPRDLEDAGGVVRRRGSDLDWPYVERWIADFAKVEGKEDLGASLARIRGEAGG